MGEFKLEEASAKWFSSSLSTSLSNHGSVERLVLRTGGRLVWGQWLLECCRIAKPDLASWLRRIQSCLWPIFRKYSRGYTEDFKAWKVEIGIRREERESELEGFGFTTLLCTILPPLWFQSILPSLRRARLGRLLRQAPRFGIVVFIPDVIVSLEFVNMGRGLNTSQSPIA